MTLPPKPTPHPYGLNAEWYAWCGRGELRFQRCGSCGRWRHPPRYRCAACGSAEWSWDPSTGQGWVWSWTVTHQALHPSYTNDVPYAVMVVELAEGPRVVAGLRGLDPSLLALGMELSVGFEALGEDMALPVFSPRP